MKSPAPPRCAGFTLVEVVVALAILALGLGVIYQSFGWSLRRSAWLSQREAALLIAQSSLARIRGNSRVLAGDETEQLGAGLQTTTRIVLRQGVVDPISPLQPFDVTVEVSWGPKPSQQVRLQSIEIGRVAP